MSIKSIRHKGLKCLFASDNRSKLPQGSVERIADILHALDTATAIEEMAAFPGWHLHRFKGGRKDSWSVSVTGNWRIVFRFDDGDAYDVDFVDYH